MKIKHYLYNCFVIEEGGTKIAIDPGQNLWLFDLRSLIPKSEWSSISHVLVTHGDPDHYWQADRVATAGSIAVASAIIESLYMGLTERVTIFAHLQWTFVWALKMYNVRK